MFPQSRKNLGEFRTIFSVCISLCKLILMRPNKTETAVYIWLPDTYPRDIVVRMRTVMETSRGCCNVCHSLFLR